MRRLAGFNIAVALLPISVLAQATVEGRVGLPKSHSAPVVVKRYEIVTRGGALSTQPPLAVVYLAGAFPKIKSSSTKQIAQKDLAFVPPLLPVQVGTRVEFPNLDDTYHSIFSYSPAKRFDLGRYRWNSPTSTIPITAFFRTHQRSGSIWAAIARRRDLSRRRFLILQDW